VKPASRFGDPVNAALAFAVFAITLTVYTCTMTPTVPFWDSGEFIAASATLGVPHPPGTPLYVLLGRVFAMFPIADVARRVNWMSALMSSITILFTYLITCKIARRVIPEDEDGGGRAIPYVAAVTAAFLAAFATTFWDNAIEAEVYAGACALMTFAVWLVLRWYERLGEGTEDGLLLVITYLVGLGVGIHLGVAIAAWAVVIFVFYVRPEYLRRWDYVGWALVTLSLGLGIQFPLTPEATNLFTEFVYSAFVVAPVVLGVSVVRWMMTGKAPRLAMWSSGLFMLGVSVHLYLLIRANLDPAINEGMPKDWTSLWKLLIRDQYKPDSPLHRRAPWDYQVYTMWLRYMGWNFTLGLSTLTSLLPLGLAGAGAALHWIKDKKTALILIVLFVFLGPAMVFYLNFQNPEVRDRDYFFVQNFQFLAIWVGLGAAWVLGWTRRALGRLAVAGLSGAFVAMSLLPLPGNWFTHDRSGFYLAHDLAYNMLASLEPDAIIFTNGDNDTFPVWYMQEVEGFRKDVRVVNLSLINTSWYLWQLKNMEPKVPLRWTDPQIFTVTDCMQFVAAARRGGEVVPSRELREAWDQKSMTAFASSLEAVGQKLRRALQVRDLAVEEIIAANQWERPLYIAVSVPDTEGLDSQLVMEGLAHRIEPKPPERPVDIAVLEHNANEVFRYDGMVVPDPSLPPDRIGVFDATVSKDSEPSRMCLNNHAAAFSRLAYEYANQGDSDKAMVAVENADAIAPGYLTVAMAKGYVLERLEKWSEAEAHYRKTLEANPDGWQIYTRLAAVLLARGDVDGACRELQEGIRAIPDTFELYLMLSRVLASAGRKADAAGPLRDWLVRHPEDQNVRQYLKQLNDLAAPPADSGAGADSGR